MALFTLSSGAQAAYMPYSCTWIEKAGTVLSSAPKNCITKGLHFESEALEERVDAAKPHQCVALKIDLGKTVENASALSDGKDVFTVVQHCKDMF
ncbi:hypothetical protein [Pseudomonas serbica]|uniref:hypothetical protein n=1 Tax=Pseudomonas serbica TaxID=2965074 RepID=UPI00237A83D8|nr:hypothetical protein [Pseudomonas serbica]